MFVDSSILWNGADECFQKHLITTISGISNELYSDWCAYGL